jgi:hypothetical protein
VSEIDGQKLLDSVQHAINAGHWSMRSCGHCNAAHQYLMDPENGPLIRCFDCHNWYWHGVNLSELAESLGAA